MSENTSPLGAPYVYQSLNEVPPGWRTLRNARLSIGQVNLIVQRAYSHPFQTENGPVPSYGQARAWFCEDHEIISDLWVTKQTAPPVSPGEEG